MQTGPVLPLGPLRAGELRLGTAYLGRDPADIREIAEVADWVLLPMSEHDLEHDLPKVRSLVDAAHAANLSVVLDPWRVGDVFAGEAETTLRDRHPDERQVSSDGKVRNSLSPLSPAFRSYMSRWLDAAADVGADAVMWDEPHYWHGGWAGDDRLYASTDAWHRERFGRDFPAHATPEMTAFFTKTLGDVLLDLTQEARAKGLGVWLDLTPRPEHQDLWRRLAPHVDSLGVSAYEDLPRDIAMLKDAAGAEKAHAWVQGFRVRRGDEGAITEGIEQAYANGMREISVWSYRGSEAWPGLESDEPAAAWEATRQGFEAVRKLHARSTARR